MCKGRQHMQWPREVVQSIPQIRASAAGNDWVQNCQKYILKAYQNVAQSSQNIYASLL